MDLVILLFVLFLFFGVIGLILLVIKMVTLDHPTDRANIKHYWDYYWEMGEE